LCRSQTASNDPNQIFRRPTAVWPTFSIFSPAVSGSASERAVPTDYSTMSAFVPLMKPNTSVRSAAGTSKVSRVVSRWPIKRCQSLSLMPTRDARSSCRGRRNRAGRPRASTGNRSAIAFRGGCCRRLGFARTGRAAHPPAAGPGGRQIPRRLHRIRQDAHKGYRPSPFSRSNDWFSPAARRDHPSGSFPPRAPRRKPRRCPHGPAPLY